MMFALYMITESDHGWPVHNIHCVSHDAGKLTERGEANMKLQALNVVASETLAGLYQTLLEADPFLEMEPLWFNK